MQHDRKVEEGGGLLIVLYICAIKESLFEQRHPLVSV